MSQHKAQQGFLTFAQNTPEVDYLHLAYVQALNIKATQRNTQFAVVVDAPTRELVNEDHLSVFDYVIDLTIDHNSPASNWKLANEWQAFWLTPFKETIKLESDLLFTRSIDHWWDTFRFREVFLSHGCRNYQQQFSDSRKYRKLFDDNHLPDVYSGLMYFRFSQTARDFFMCARAIYENWPAVRDTLRNCDDNTATTDVVFALAAQIIGPELCTLPSADFINFTHMKPAHNGFSEELTFSEVFLTEFDRGMIRINNINQYHPLHYYDKKFPTGEMIEYYRSRITQGI